MRPSVHKRNGPSMPQGCFSGPRQNMRGGWWETPGGAACVGGLHPVRELLATRHVIEPLPLPSPRVARAEVNTSTSSGRVFAFPLPSPQISGRAHLRSGPGLCPGFPPSRAGRQGGWRRVSGQESSRKSGPLLFPSLIEVRSAGRYGNQRELQHGDLGE